MDAYCEIGLYTLKLCLLDHFIEDSDLFGCWELLHSSPYERTNVHIKLVYHLTSKRSTVALYETLSAINKNTRRRTQELQNTRLTVRSTVTEKLARVSTVSPFLVRDTSKLSANCIKKLCEWSPFGGALERRPPTYCQYWKPIPFEQLSIF